MLEIKGSMGAVMIGESGSRSAGTMIGIGTITLNGMMVEVVVAVVTVEGMMAEVTRGEWKKMRGTDSEKTISGAVYCVAKRIEVTENGGVMTSLRGASGVVMRGIIDPNATIHLFVTTAKTRVTWLWVKKKGSHGS